jgi:hypothetical protein
MKEITLSEFKQLKKIGPYSPQNLIPGSWYYIYDNRKTYNPVYIGKYVEPVRYFNENSIMYNYKFTNVSYLVKPSNIRNEPREVFGNVEKYYEVIDKPTKLDIKNKKTTLKELHHFLKEKKAEPHNSPQNISFFGKDYRKSLKVNDDLQSNFLDPSRRTLNLKNLSSSFSSSSSRRSSTPKKSSSSSKRSSTPKKSSSSSRRSSTPRTSSSSSRRRYRTRRTYR